MHDYFFTPMRDKQLRSWERHRHRGLVIFLSGRGLVIGTAVACLTLIFWGSSGSSSWLLDGFFALVCSIPMSWLEWDSTEKRYRKTLAIHDGQTGK